MEDLLRRETWIRQTDDDRGRQGAGAGLGFRRGVLIGHGGGARVAHRHALEHAAEVEKIVVLDIIPTRAVWITLTMR
jgi:pimeloyl-ACP methyl ester carboxylesterase